MVENYGETVQDRAIPNPIRTFDEAYANFRESLPWAIVRTLRIFVLFVLFFASHTAQTKVYCTLCTASLTLKVNRTQGTMIAVCLLKPSLID